MNANIIALSKLVKDKALDLAKVGLTSGVHEVDCKVHLKGTIKVGEDSKVDVRSTVDYKAAFATVVSMLQTTIERQVDEEKAERLLPELIENALRQTELSAGLAEKTMPLIKIVENRVTKVTGTKPKKGVITTKLTFGIIEETTKEPQIMPKRLRQMRIRAIERA